MAEDNGSDELRGKGCKTWAMGRGDECSEECGRVQRDGIDGKMKKGERRGKNNSPLWDGR